MFRARRSELELEFGAAVNRAGAAAAAPCDCSVSWEHMFPIVSCSLVLLLLMCLSMCVRVCVCLRCRLADLANNKQPRLRLRIWSGLEGAGGGRRLCHALQPPRAPDSRARVSACSSRVESTRPDARTNECECECECRRCCCAFCCATSTRSPNPSINPCSCKHNAQNTMQRQQHNNNNNNRSQPISWLTVCATECACSRAGARVALMDRWMNG